MIDDHAKLEVLMREVDTPGQHDPVSELIALIGQPPTALLNRLKRVVRPE